ncbi:MAG: hypothetical protein HYZ27_07395, partial [Deltaproteobacteria bacterium]|nr:hypothetical protein [Deltaproteobacteria bacterium]
CADQVDNDGDGLVDCDDADCANSDACGCLDPATGGPCTELCSDQLDNDGDGLVDCADVYDCYNASNCACDPQTQCCTQGDPGCTPPPPETACDDQLDNDGDGAIDCRDSDCTDATVCGRSCCVTWDANQVQTCVTSCDPAGGNCYCSPSFCVENGGTCQ